MHNDDRSLFLEKLLHNILETRFEDIDQDAVAHAKNRIIDTMGCLIGGADGPGNRELIDLVLNWGGKKEATILLNGGKVPAHNAAMVNSIMARSFDFEPVSPLVDGVSVPGHISGTTVMAALTMGETMGVSGKELLTALLVGDDTATRILVAGGFGFDLGWDCIGTVNAFGTTAIAGRMLGLNMGQMRHAFGIVLNQLSGSMQMVLDKTTSFKICHGLSAQKGISSAELAKAGWTGPKDALFGRFGYYHLYTEGCHSPDTLTMNLGKTFYSDGTIKPYPCCRITHAAIDCALAIAAKHDLDPSQIKEAHLYVSPDGMPMCGQPFIPGEFPHADAIWSYQYTVAAALLRKSIGPNDFTMDAIFDPATLDMVERIRLKELPDADFYRAELRLFLSNGNELVESCEGPKGDPIRNPMTKEEILEKFRLNVDFSGKISHRNAERLLSDLQNCEDIDNVASIARMLNENAQRAHSP